MPKAPSMRLAIIPGAPAPKRRVGCASYFCPREEIAMSLTAQQLQEFADEGYLFLPGCFAEEEVAILRDEAERIYATNRQEVWREKNGGPRTPFCPPNYQWGVSVLRPQPPLIPSGRQVVG